MTTPDPTPLPYASSLHDNASRARWMLPAYLLGLLTAALAWTTLAAFVGRHRPDVFLRASTFFCLVFIVGAPIAACGLSLAVWTRHLRWPPVRYPRFLPIFLAGFLAGLIVVVPLALKILPGLLVHLLCALFAGLLLCRRDRSAGNLASHAEARYRKICIATVIPILLFLVAGYISAAVSRHACEQDIASRFLLMGAARPIHLRNDHGPDTARILAERSIPTTQTVGDVQFPWVDISPPTIEGPFVLSIDWEWVSRPSTGGGNRTRYLCFFGYIFRWTSQVKWTA